MKKLSFSLVAVLAIVVAIGSAFATKEKKPPLGGFFVLVTPVTQTAFTNNYTTTYKDQLSPYTQIAPQTDEDIAALSLCPSGSAKVCAVRYPGYTIGNDAANLDVTGTSDFPSSAPNSAPDVIYRAN